MGKNRQEKKIVKNIIILPIISIIILSIIIFAIFVIFLNNFQKTQIEELTQNFINRKKELSKTRLYDLEESINLNIKHLNKNIKNNLKEKLDEAEAIINAISENHKNIDIKQLKSNIIKILMAIKYNKGRGYYFAFDKDSNITMIHSIKKFINKDMTNFKDVRGTNLVNAIKKIVKDGNGSGYLKLFFSKPSDPNHEYEKIVYVRYFPKLNWIIGTGEYIKDAEEELQKDILEKIENKKFGDNGYFWIHSIDGVLLAHPYRKKDIGKVDLELKDVKGIKIIKLFIEEAKKNPKGAFIKYYWKNPKTNKIEEKISFVKEFKEWGWVIGTGIYLNDIKSIIAQSKSTFKHKIDRLFIFIILIITLSLFFTIILSLFLSKQTKKLFMIYKNDLENRVKNAVKESEEKDKMLQQQSKLASMGEMMENIAHQWRQPLNALGINIQNLEDDYDDGLINEKFLDKYIDKNMKIIHFMSNTIEDFRNFFRIDKKKRKFSVKESIEQVFGIQSAVLEKNGIDVVIEGEDFEVLGYESEFKQVLLNIINNSKDALIDNKVKNPKITIVMKIPKIVIKDNAGGIPNEIVDRVFEPYFTTKDQSKGTGLGLYMSKMIIERNMNGKLYVKNGKDGAKFIIELKVDE